MEGSFNSTANVADRRWLEAVVGAIQRSWLVRLISATPRAMLLALLIAQVALLQLTGRSIAEQLKYGLAILAAYGAIMGFLAKTGVRKQIAEPMTSDSAWEFFAGSRRAWAFLLLLSAQRSENEVWLGGGLLDRRGASPSRSGCLWSVVELLAALVSLLVGVVVGFAAILAWLVGVFIFLIVIVPLASLVYLFVSNWADGLFASGPITIQWSLGKGKAAVSSLITEDAVAFKSGVVALISGAASFALTFIGLF